MKICAPFAGIVRYKVSQGDAVTTGQELASVEATKLEAPIIAPGPGIVAEITSNDFDDVVGGDILLRVVSQEKP
ncbi:acetyl-CoA carboxylase biotin carboxyl carrier protein subunit [Corynebacterium rouxii]|uniref:Acetyl-CoA carboxylase biotin carboxyl carrier protein subunit n=1 Tax=Corynebacterium rouxii TaxID=2719119 RepID=A0A6I8MEI5_9CORY|nr:acetyl-CoA carboxylase biotin carboxyl carrier protein subunit [Corynebacterium rouxii]MDT9408748.1 acetyl-CoA carboxylase biotin carboxyl carrier protein subunit [Corynebacterium rouxii]MDT9410928.1 acetyl-CoA carboxylase biotin carboxyl carrier protein subunit [Corynebacterium rouxii]VZH85126.1 acetyl-CoA carboxylase biotin carboxyl carrier protein subunit [Corynebacterium rouxii]